MLHFDCMGYETPEIVLARMEKAGILIMPVHPLPSKLPNRNESGLFAPVSSSQYSWEIQGWPGVDMDSVNQMQLDWPERHYYRIMTGAPVCDFDGNPGRPLSVVLKEDDPMHYVYLYGCPRAEGIFCRDQVLNPQVDVIHYV